MFAKIISLSEVEVDNLLYPIDPLQVAAILPLTLANQGFTRWKKERKWGFDTGKAIGVWGPLVPQGQGPVISITASL